MLQSSRTSLQSVLGEIDDWDRFSHEVSLEFFAPDAPVRALGESVHDILVVECGLFAVATPGKSPQWAAAGAIIGIAASLSGATSTVAVTAVRHGRIARVPAQALWNQRGDVNRSVATVARLAQLPDHDLSTLPPDPLIITALLESCDVALETTITSHLEAAVNALSGWRLVHVAPTAPLSTTSLADELANHELGAQTVVYVVRGTDGDRAADIVDHADRVILFQPFGVTDDGSAALAVACDDSPRRHTDLVVVYGKQEATSSTTQRMQLPPKVNRMHLLPDPSTAQLESLLTELRSNARDHEALREFSVFADLSDQELAWVQTALRWERLDGGSMLLHQGKKAADAWLIRAGRLEEVRTTPAGEQHVSWRVPGDLVGELALLSDRKRTTSVRAVRDSTVARLDRQTFEALLARSPGFGSAVARQIAMRSAGRPADAKRRARFFAVVPLTLPARVDQFIATFATACDEAGLDATVVDTERLNATLGPKASSTRRGDAGDGDIIRWLDGLEQQHDAVILVCSGNLDTWTRRAIRQCDNLLLVADGTSSPELRAVELELARGVAGDAANAPTPHSDSALGLTGARHLVLLQPNGISEATGTEAWLTLRPQHTHHHVRADERGDVARVARRLTGRAVALALSGASSRAPAHFGVVRAMADFGIPIDIASGSSSGAGVAALLAAGYRAEEGLDRAIAIITAGTPRLSHFQPPITALTSGGAADGAVQAVFGDRLLEDQLIPAVLTAVDIRRHRAVHLTRGPLWKLVRASGSLPLVWPPVWHEDDLLVDGGILNYLPAEVFGDQADDGLIIASNLDSTAGQGAPAFEGTREYGTVMNSWGELARRIGRSKAPQPAGLIEILFHTMAIPSFQQQEGLAALAERENVCVLTPPLDAFGLFEVDAVTGRKLESASWQHARLELKKVAALWHSRTEWRVPVNA